MGSMGHETYYAGGELIDQIKAAGLLGKMRHDGGDIILFELTSGEMVSVHLIESGIPVYEIRKILAANNEKGIYTLFMLWSMMMLPSDGQRWRGEDWMEAFFSLYGDIIYGYDIFDSEVYLFPVYFRGSGRQRVIEYGTILRARTLGVGEVETNLPGLTGRWRVAKFAYERTAPNATTLKVSGLEIYYQLLGVEPGDDRDTIKRAYRVLARRLHPDTNTSPNAHEQMQRLNEAYDRVMESFDQ